MRPATLLLVEDDLVDYLSLTRALRASELKLNLVWARDAIEALAIMRGHGQPALSRPYIVLVDLNMPRMSGIEFLAELRSDELLRDTVVLVLTTSAAQEDKVQAYGRQAAGYILKPVASELHKLVRLLESYCAVVDLPGEREARNVDSADP